MPRVRLQTSSSPAPPAVPVESRLACSSESNGESESNQDDSNRFDHSNPIDDLNTQDAIHQDSMEWDFDFESSTPSTAVVWHSMSSSLSPPSPPLAESSSSSSSSPTKQHEIKSILKFNRTKNVASKWKSSCPMFHHRNDSPIFTNKKEHKMVQFQKDVQFRQKQECAKKPKYDNPINHDHHPSKRPLKTIRRRGTNFITMSHGSTSDSKSNTSRSTKDTPTDAKDVQKCNHGSPKHVMMTPTTTTTPCTERDHGTIVTPTNTTATNTNTNTITNTRSLFGQRGIGIDTRYIQRFAGDAISQRFRNLVYEFLYTSAESGLLPSILSSTTMSSDTHHSPTTVSSLASLSSSTPSSSTTTRFHIPCKGTRLYFHMLSKQQMIDVILPPVSIPVCETTMDEIHASTTSMTCPPELKATESWNQLDELGKIVHDSIYVFRSKTITVHKKSSQMHILYYSEFHFDGKIQGVQFTSHGYYNCHKRCCILY